MNQSITHSKRSPRSKCLRLTSLTRGGSDLA
jgi:hypothetical protein